MQINGSVAGKQTPQAAVEIGHDWTAKIRIGKVELPDFVLKVLREILVVLIPIEYSFGHSVWRCLLFLVVYPRCRNNFLPSRRHNNALIFPLDSAHHLMEMTKAIAEAR